MRLQWKVNEKSDSGRITDVFEQNDDWGDGKEGEVCEDWIAPSSPKKTKFTISESTETLSFEQLLEPYLVEFEAEDLEKL